MSNVILFPLSPSRMDANMLEYYKDLLSDAESICEEIRHISTMNPEWAAECIDDLTAIAEHANSAAFGGNLRIERMK